MRRGDTAQILGRGADRRDESTLRSWDMVQLVVEGLVTWWWPGDKVGGRGRRQVKEVEALRGMQVGRVRTSASNPSELPASIPLLSPQLMGP